MFKIGDFSRLSLVSVKALRYYDELGLLKPARVDDDTGYRYYATNQLARLNRILVMKDMGLSLEQIALLLDNEPGPEQIRGMLRLKQVELNKQIVEGQERLRRIEAWLQAFEQEVTMPAYDIILKNVAPLRVASVSGTAPNMEQLGPTLNGLFDKVINSIVQQGAMPAMPALTLYHNLGASETDINVEACMAFDGNLNESGEMKISTLPAVETMASVIHHGDFRGLNQAYSAIFSWIEANHYRIVGLNRELNLEYERGGDTSKYVTEIQFPVEKV